MNGATPRGPSVLVTRRANPRITPIATGDSRENPANGRVLAAVSGRDGRDPRVRPPRHQHARPARRGPVHLLPVLTWRRRPRPVRPITTRVVTPQTRTAPERASRPRP